MAKIPSPPKKRVTTVVWIDFITDIIDDLIKPFLLGLVVLGPVGVGLGFIGAEALSMFEVFLAIVTLFTSGFFRKGKSSATNLVLTGAMFMADFVPLLDNLPVTSVTTFFMIMNARKADEADQKEYDEKVAKIRAEEKRQQEFQLQVALAAAQRANIARAQAMQISLEAANNNAIDQQQVANDNDDLEYAAAA